MHPALLQKTDRCWMMFFFSAKKMEASIAWPVFCWKHRGPRKMACLCVEISGHWTDVFSSYQNLSAIRLCSVLLPKESRTLNDAFRLLLVQISILPPIQKQSGNYGHVCRWSRHQKWKPRRTILCPALPVAWKVYKPTARALFSSHLYHSQNALSSETCAPKSTWLCTLFCPKRIIDDKCSTSAKAL